MLILLLQPAVSVHQHLPRSKNSRLAEAPAATVPCVFTGHPLIPEIEIDAIEIVILDYPIDLLFPKRTPTLGAWAHQRGFFFCIVAIRHYPLRIRQINSSLRELRTRLYSPLLTMLPIRFSCMRKVHKGNIGNNLHPVFMALFDNPP